MTDDASLLPLLRALKSSMKHIENIPFKYDFLNLNERNPFPKLLLRFSQNMVSNQKNRNNSDPVRDILDIFFLFGRSLLE